MLQDLTVVVAGVGPGLGRTVAVQAASHGARVVLAARTRSRLDEVAAEIESAGGRAMPVVTDLTDADGCAHLVAATIEEYGRLDVVVNNSYRQPPFQTVDELPLDTWESAVRNNCTAALLLTQAAVPHMIRQGGGAIVMVNTVSIRTADPRFGAYAAAKSALFSLARTMANELGPHQIRVNTVCPGYIWGDAVLGYLERQAQRRGITVEAAIDEVAGQLALRRIPDAAAVADAVVFLASPMARAITGVALDVNGGQYLPF